MNWYKSDCNCKRCEENHSIFIPCIYPHSIHDLGWETQSQCDVKIFIPYCPDCLYEVYVYGSSVSYGSRDGTGLEDEFELLNYTSRFHVMSYFHLNKNNTGSLSLIREGKMNQFQWRVRASIHDKESDWNIDCIKKVNKSGGLIFDINER